jgi:hypothetical protein
MEFLSKFNLLECQTRFTRVLYDSSTGQQQKGLKLFIYLVPLIISFVLFYFCSKELIAVANFISTIITSMSIFSGFLLSSLIMLIEKKEKTMRLFDQQQLERIESEYVTRKLSKKEKIYKLLSECTDIAFYLLLVSLLSIFCSTIALFNIRYFTSIFLTFSYYFLVHFFIIFLILIKRMQIITLLKVDD